MSRIVLATLKEVSTVFLPCVSGFFHAINALPCLLMCPNRCRPALESLQRISPILYIYPIYLAADVFGMRKPPLSGLLPAPHKAQEQRRGVFNIDPINVPGWCEVLVH